MAELSEQEAANLKALLEKSGHKLADPNASGANWKQEIAPLLHTIGESIKNQQIQIDGMRQQQTQTPIVPKEEAKPVDLNELTPEELVQHVVDRVKTEQTQPLATVVAQTQEQNRKQDLTAQAHTASEKHDDFDQYFSEMKGILQNNPQLNIEQAYALAKIEDPDKTMRVDESLKEKRELAVVAAEKEKGKVGDNVVNAQDRFGGLTPTSTLHTSKEQAKMTQAEAGDAAWESSEMDDALKEFSGQ